MRDFLSRTITQALYGRGEREQLWAEQRERRIRPANHLESAMAKATSIHEHLTTLYLLAKELNLRVALELGAGDGNSTLALLWAARESFGKVFSVDINKCEKASRLVASNGLSKYWNFIQGDDLKIEWKRPVDLLFLDTVHTYKQVLAELKKYEPFVRKGGVVIVHDIVTWNGVFKAVKKYMKERNDLRLYKYFNNNGRAVIFKGRKEDEEGV